MTLYFTTFAVTFGILIFLKFCEGSPNRSWKVVIPLGVLLGGIAGYYFNHAFPPKAAALPAAQKATAYQQELVRTFRRIAGVDAADIDGSTVTMNFSEDKPTEELKRIARDCGGSTAYFISDKNPGGIITVHFTVRGQDRYEMKYEINRGVIDEKIY